jgi:hypothetical protein
MNKLADKLPEVRMETVTIGRREIRVIRIRRWATAVLAEVRTVPVKIHRNGVSKCEEHGNNNRCSHVIQLEKTCIENNIWK